MSPGSSSSLEGVRQYPHANTQCSDASVIDCASQHDAIIVCVTIGFSKIRGLNCMYLLWYLSNFGLGLVIGLHQSTVKTSPTLPEEKPQRC